MSSGTVPRSPVENWEQIRDEWIQTVDVVLSHVEGWCQAEGWLVHRETKDIEEDRLGHYHIGVLLIDTPAGRLHLDPISRFIVGAEGRIDVYSFPHYQTAILIRVQGDWRFRTVDGSAKDRPFEHAAFVEIAKQLTSPS